MPGDGALAWMGCVSHDPLPPRHETVAPHGMTRMTTSLPKSVPS